MKSRGITRLDDGTCIMRAEWLWVRVKRWAKRNGHAYSNFHVEGVGAL